MVKQQPQAAAPAAGPGWAPTAPVDFLRVPPSLLSPTPWPQARRQHRTSTDFIGDTPDSTCTNAGYQHPVRSICPASALAAKPSLYEGSPRTEPLSLWESLQTRLPQGGLHLLWADACFLTALCLPGKESTSLGGLQISGKGLLGAEGALSTARAPALKKDSMDAGPQALRQLSRHGDWLLEEFYVLEQDSMSSLSGPWEGSKP